MKAKAKAYYCLASIAIALSAFAGNEANPDALELAPLPMPVEFKSDMDKPVPFDASTTVTVQCPDKAAADWLSRHFAEWYGKDAPKVVANVSNVEMLPLPTANSQTTSLETGNTGNSGNNPVDEAYAVRARRA